MGHHLNSAGEFQSDKHPGLPPDRIRLNFNAPLSQRALRVLAEDYADADPGLAADINTRLDTLSGRTSEPPAPEQRNIANAAKLLSDIAEGLKDLERAHEEKIRERGHAGVSSIKFEHVNVTFYEGGGDTGDVVWDGGLATALDFLSNDTYWDEDRDWAGADTASVSYG